MGASRSTGRDTPDSPHLFVPKLRAEPYIAAASDDELYPAALAERFRHALDVHKVRYRQNTYRAAHGWMKPDVPMHDPASAEHGWSEMLELFGRVLGR